MVIANEEKRGSGAKSSDHHLKRVDVSTNQGQCRKVIAVQLEHLDWWLELLEGKNVNLRIMEKEDLPLLLKWFNDPEFAGNCNPMLEQQSKEDLEKK